MALKNSNVEQTPMLTKLIGDKLYVWAGKLPASPGFIQSPLIGTPEWFRRRQHVKGYENAETYTNFIDYEPEINHDAPGTHKWYQGIINKYGPYDNY